MADDLYDADFLIWTEQQAALLRRVAAGELVNDLDWPNLIEEVESLGRAELHAVQSLLRQAFIHLLKIAGWPDSDAVPHWRAETIGFLGDAADRFTPGMRQRIDLGMLYHRARRQVRAERIDGAPPQALPQTCPFQIEGLLDDDVGVETLAARLAAAPEGGDGG